MSPDIEEMTWLGAAVFSAQRVEFGLYGLAAHVPNSAKLGKNNKFKELTPETFLRGDPKELKATLGQLVHSFGDQFFIRTDELETFVKDRNFICHNYWRSTQTNIQGAQNKLDNPTQFLRNFVERCDNFLAIIQGLLAHLIEAAAKNGGRNLKATDKQKREMDTYLAHAQRYLSEKKTT